MNKSTEQWMEKLVENYKIPSKEKTKKASRILTEEQLKIIKNGKN